MGIQKWEIRYPLVSIIFLLIIGTSKLQDEDEVLQDEGAKDDLDVACEITTPLQNCKDQSYEALYQRSAGATCEQRFCFMYAYHKDYAKLMEETNPLEINIRYGEENDLYPVAEGTHNMTCWVRGQENQVKDLKLTSSSRVPETLKTTILTDPNTGNRVIIQQALIKLIRGLQSQEASCEVERGKNLTVTIPKKTYTYFYLNQTRPTITGRKRLYIGDTTKYTCITEEVTINEENDYKMTVQVSFGTLDDKLKPKEDGTITRVGDEEAPKRYKFVRTLEFPIVTQLGKRAIITCTGTNTAPPSGPITMAAPNLNVDITPPQIDLSTTFTVVAVLTGLGAVFVAGGMVYYYFSKKKEDKARAGSKPSAKPGDKGPPGGKPDGKPGDGDKGDKKPETKKPEVTSEAPSAAVSTAVASDAPSATASSAADGPSTAASDAPSSAPSDAPSEAASTAA